MAERWGARVTPEGLEPRERLPQPQSSLTEPRGQRGHSRPQTVRRGRETREAVTGKAGGPGAAAVAARVLQEALFSAVSVAVVFHPSSKLQGGCCRVLAAQVKR